MSGETEQHVSGWTVDTLKEHIDIQLELRDRALMVALASADKRLDGMNEFRQTLSDQAALFMPRTEAEQRMEQTRERLTAVERFVNQTTGRSSGRESSWGYIVGALGIFIAVASIAVGAFT